MEDLDTSGGYCTQSTPRRARDSPDGPALDAEIA